MPVFGRRVALAVGVAPLAMVCVVAACGLDTSGLDLGGPDGSVGVDDSGGGDALALDGGHADAFSSDAMGSSDSHAGGDASEASVTPDAGDSCASTVEICNNGIDDDCDGRIDCADPQCSAWTCVGGPIPQGWTLAEVTATTPSSCSMGYQAATPIFAGPFAAAECTCGATLTTPGTCKAGMIGVTGNGTTMAAGCAAFSATFSANDGGCVTYQPFSPIAGENLDITPAPYTPGVCTPAPTTTIPPIAPSGQSCALGVATGGGCPSQGAGGACIPDVASGADACIVHAGNVTCPTGIGFDTAHVVGTGTTDTRGCSNTCTATGPTATCVDAQLTEYTDTTCTNSGAVIQANGMCSPIPGAGAGAPTYTAQTYSAVVHGETCGGSTVTPTGGVALTGTMTYCCR